MSNTINIEEEIKEYGKFFSNSGIEEYDQERMQVLRDLSDAKGIDTILEFACSVQLPKIVGVALAKLEDSNFDKFLPKILLKTNHKMLLFASGYIETRYYFYGWDWVDSIPKKTWTSEQIGYFFALLPFASDAWERAEDLLEKDESAYWLKTRANPYLKQDFQPAIEKLVKFERHDDAFRLYSLMLEDDNLRSDLIIHTLLTNTRSIYSGFNDYNELILKLIKLVKADTNIDMETILKIEWLYLPIFTGREVDRPVIIERKLATDAEFFCQVIEMVYGYDTDVLMKHGLRNNSETQQTHVRFALRDWKTLPGTNGQLDPDKFKKWFQEVKNYEFDAYCLESALNVIGDLLRNTPEDKDGLWINYEIAELLSEKDNDALRAGYKLGARMDSKISPNPKLEENLVNSYYEMAGLVKERGCNRFAETLNEIAEFHKKRANEN